MKYTPESHILFITYHLPTEEEPGSARPWVEARLLRDAGYRVTVLTSAVHYMTGEYVGPGRGWCREEMRDDICILRLWNITDYRRSFFRRILSYSIFGLLAIFAACFRAPRIQCIFTASDPFVVTPFILLLTSIVRARVVLDERDLYPETAIALGYLREGFLSRTIARLQAQLRRRAAFVVTATPGIAECLHRAGIASDRLAMLYNGDPYEVIASDGQIPLEISQFRAAHRYVIAYMGTIGLMDDIHTILDSASELMSDPDVGFLIIGDGECREAYVQRASEMQLEHVRFTGPFTRKQARAIISYCDISVQTHPQGQHFAYTLSSKILDYLRMGIPTIFSGEGDTAALLAEAQAGITVPAEDASSFTQAILLLIHNAELRRRMGEAGQRWFQAHVNRQAALEVIRRALSQESPASVSTAGRL